MMFIFLQNDLRISSEVMLASQRAKRDWLGCMLFGCYLAANGTKPGSPRGWALDIDLMRVLQKDDLNKKKTQIESLKSIY